jgi:hypothetical protein
METEGALPHSQLVHLVGFVIKKSIIYVTKFVEQENSNTQTNHLFKLFSY